MKCVVRERSEGLRFEKLLDVLLREFRLESDRKVIVEIAGSNFLEVIVPDPICLCGPVIEWILGSERLRDESEVRIGGTESMKCLNQLIVTPITQARVEQNVVFVWATVAQPVGHETVAG